MASSLTSTAFGSLADSIMEVFSDVSVHFNVQEFAITSKDNNLTSLAANVIVSLLRLLGLDVDDKKSALRGSNRVSWLNYTVYLPHSVAIGGDRVNQLFAAVG
jgi:hypothetical protein